MPPHPNTLLSIILLDLTLLLSIYTLKGPFCIHLSKIGFIILPRIIKVV